MTHAIPNLVMRITDLWVRLATAISRHSSTKATLKRQEKYIHDVSGHVSPE